MEDKPKLPGLTQETEQESIQRRANRPRRQPAGLPDDRHTAEMRAALEGASDTAGVARATNQLAPMTVLDDGDDGIIMEVDESSNQSLEKQLAAANAQLKDYKTLLDAAKSLTGSTEDIPARTLATGLLSAWEKQQTDVRMMRTDLEQIQREKEQTQTTLRALEDQLSVLRKDRVFEACKKHQMKWWKRFCLCAGFRKNNKVGVAPDEDDQSEDWETHFADQLAKQSSTIRSLQKDKSILEAQITKLKDGGEAAKRMVKEMAEKNKEMEKKRKQVEKEKKQAEKERKQAEKEKKKAEGETRKAEGEKDKAENMKKEMERQLKQAERKKDYVERLNRALLEKLGLMKQDISQKTEQIDQLNIINDRLQTVTDLKVMREAKTNVDRVVIACLSFVSPQELACQDLLTFEHSSASVSQGKTILDMVGKGGYGEVMLGRLSGEKHPVAIKRALVRQNLTPEQAESDKKRRNIRFEKEARACLLMSTSPYFPRFLGTVMIVEDQCLVTEFIGDKVQGKSYILMDAIIPRKGCDPVPVIKKWNLVAIGEDIVRGVMALHSRSLLHNDIKDDNVLVEFRKNRWVAVIIDLGMVSTVTYPYFSGCKESMSSHEKGYFIHVAPEVLRGCESSVASDVYSVGIILNDIGRFMRDDGLITLAGMCSKEDPRERPCDLEEVLPGVVDIKEKHKTLARLGGDMVGTDSEEEGEEDEDNFLTDLSERGTEDDVGEEEEEGDGAEDEETEKGQQEMDGEVEEGGAEGEDDNGWLIEEEEEVAGEEVRRGDGDEEGEGEDRGQKEMDDGVGEEDNIYQLEGAGPGGEPAGGDEQEGGMQNGYVAGAEEEAEEDGVGVAGEEVLQVLQQGENALNNMIDHADDEEGLEHAEAGNRYEEEGEQGGEDGIPEEGVERDGGEVEEDDGVG